METKTEDMEMEEPVDRYDNKVEEMNTIALISALLFGFSITLWIEFDRTLFIPRDVIFAYVFSIALMITMITSTLATVTAICIVVSFRRLQFKFGKQTNSESLRQFKRSTHELRHFVRYFINSCYVSLFIAVGVYSHVKWVDTVDSDFLYILCYILLLIGWIALVYVYYSIKRAYVSALNSKNN